MVEPYESVGKNYSEKFLKLLILYTNFYPKLFDLKACLKIIIDQNINLWLYIMKKFNKSLEMMWICLRLSFLCKEKSARQKRLGKPD